MSARKPGSTPAERTPAPRDDLAADLAVMARLEGRPLPTVHELAEMLGVSSTTAFRIIARFKRNGMLKLIDRVVLPGDICHCVADLRTRLLTGLDLDRLEQRLREDPYVSAAAAVTGKHNYRVLAVHRDMAEANAWFKAMLTEPAVIDGALTFCRPIIDRRDYAQALLAAGTG
ncbi:Lrp/AsnC family transcriptional regulator [Caulobacter sp. RL271]|uniref:Lrp/AsnC family transcriptional regulator n=1 Tax=Caulobacter segnis TaxID=88688 RepID=A0ABY4ZN24_9CAUL|nr:Lrp/AsnC family transcriptional regulator [Caulobacter segnis]USQ94207.1 Lrp/AsnC family transcriptional regulator [Caulobacter segnis]